MDVRGIVSASGGIVKPSGGGGPGRRGGAPGGVGLNRRERPTRRSTSAAASEISAAGFSGDPFATLGVHAKYGRAVV